MGTVSRRALITGVVALTALGAGSARVVDPFTLGVASGAPTPDGVVLWTRLAPHPPAGSAPDRVAVNGLSGGPSRVVEVKWELAEDERFRRVVRRGSEWARPESGFS